MKYFLIICFLLLVFLLVGCEGGYAPYSYHPPTQGFIDGYNSYPYYSLRPLGERDKRQRFDDMLWDYEQQKYYQVQPVNIPKTEMPKFTDFLPDY